MTRSPRFDPHDDPMASDNYPAAQRRASSPTQSWSNDRNALTKWVFGLITTAGCALCAWLWTGFNAHETRLVTLETQRKIDDIARTEEQRRLDLRLDRMDRKLDEVLLWQRRELHPSGSIP